MIWACEFNKKSLAVVEATHYCTNRQKSWIKNTRDFTCKRVFIYFLSCKWSQECQVRAGLGWQIHYQRGLHTFVPTSVLSVAPQSKLAAVALDIKSAFQVERKD